MKKIINDKQAIEISNKLRSKNKKIVLAGGCFDILHIGHITFLEKAKEKGDFLFILLENDNNVAKLKGRGRPINSQGDRAKILSSLIYVDYVILLNEMEKNQDYDQLIFRLKPNVIALTEGSSQKIHAQRQAEQINAEVIEVTRQLQDKSTTNLAKIILKNFGE